MVMFFQSILNAREIDNFVGKHRLTKRAGGQERKSEKEIHEKLFIEDFQFHLEESGYFF